jgi:D-lyxose ketol-isomerase
MERSRIDAAVDGARSLAAEAGIALPGFASWSRPDWLAGASSEAAGVRPAMVDGLEQAVRAGVPVRLEPGQSIQVPDGVFHRFWADGGVVLAGEVSSVNDDVDDNLFLDPFPRYAAVDEDAPARYLLVSEYAEVLGGGR